MQKQPFQVPVASAKSKGKKQKATHFDRKTLEQGLNKLLKQNDALIYKLNKISRDSLFRQDSILDSKIKKLAGNVEAYHGRIRELKTLFDTYKKEDLGEKARQFTKIIHKMVELKTSLSGAQSDISYQGVDVKAMIDGIDNMIENYQQPFRTQTISEKVQWSIHLEPREEQHTFHFGLRKGSEREFFWEMQQKQQEYLATLNVAFQMDKPAAIGRFRRDQKGDEKAKKAKGLYYNIPAYGNIKLSLSYDKQAQSLQVGHAPVIVPQMGVITNVPALNPDNRYVLDPFYGTLERINQPKPE